MKLVREIGQNENYKKKKVERTPEEWRECYRERSKKYYDKNKEKLNERKRELYNECVGNKKDNE